MDTSDDEDEGYEVGYGKPPKHSRWTKGQSGNPAGKPKGSRGLRGDLNAILNLKQTVTLRGESQTGSKQFLYLFMLATRAAAGDLKAAALLGPLILQIFGPEDRNAGQAQLSKLDQELLERALAPEPPDGEGEHEGDEPSADKETGEGGESDD